MPSVTRRSRDALRLVTVEASNYYNLKRKLDFLYLVVLYLIIHYVIHISFPRMSFSGFFCCPIPYLNWHIHYTIQVYLNTQACFICGISSAGIETGWFWKMIFKLGHVLGDFPEVWQPETLFQSVATDDNRPHPLVLTISSSSVHSSVYLWVNVSMSVCIKSTVSKPKPN